MRHIRPNSAKSEMVLAPLKVSCQGALKLLHTQDIILSNGCFQQNQVDLRTAENGANLKDLLHQEPCRARRLCP